MGGNLPGLPDLNYPHGVWLIVPARADKIFILLVFIADISLMDCDWCCRFSFVLGRICTPN